MYHNYENLNLLSIRLIGDEFVINNVLLFFSNNTNIEITVDYDTDELILTEFKNTSVNNYNEYYYSKSIYNDIKKAFGKNILFSWIMKNQNGYDDAFQIELANPELDENIVLQFKAIGGNVHIYILEDLTYKYKIL